MNTCYWRKTLNGGIILTWRYCVTSKENLHLKTDIQIIVECTVAGLLPVFMRPLSYDAPEKHLNCGNSEISFINGLNQLHIYSPR